MQSLERASKRPPGPPQLSLERLKNRFDQCNESVKICSWWNRHALVVGYDGRLMEMAGIIVAVLAGLVLAVVLLLVRRSGGGRHRLTRSGLRRRAIKESERLIALVEERRASRPSDDPVIMDHELPHRRVTLHDERTQEIYRREHLPAVTELREQFAERRVRDRMLDELYEDAASEADLRTVATALGEMARRLR